MKKFFVLVMLAGFGLTATAQNFNFSNDQHIVEEMTDLYTSHYINFATSAPQAITYKFERISNNMPVDWDLSLCDYQSCYVGVPETGTMTFISLTEAEAGKEGYFNLTVSNKGIEGEGLVEVYVFEEGNHENGDTVSWHLTFKSPVATEDLEVHDFFDVYPNPAKNVLNITSKGYRSGSIYNSIGSKVINLQASTNESVDVSSLSSGVYAIALQDEFGKSFIKQFVIQ